MDLAEGVRARSRAWTLPECILRRDDAQIPPLHSPSAWFIRFGDVNVGCGRAARPPRQRPPPLTAYPACRTGKFEMRPTGSWATSSRRQTTMTPASPTLVWLARHPRPLPQSSITDGASMHRGYAPQDGWGQQCGRAGSGGGSLRPIRGQVPRGGAHRRRRGPGPRVKVPRRAARNAAGRAGRAPPPHRHWRSRRHARRPRGRPRGPQSQDSARMPARHGRRPRQARPCAPAAPPVGRRPRSSFPSYLARPRAAARDAP